MNVYIDKQRVRLDPKHTLGVGGEAQVFHWNNQAVKIFHGPDPTWDHAKKSFWQQMRKIKIEKLKRFPKGLPDSVISPQKLAYDENGQVIGYVMKAISGAEVLFMLSQRKFRQTVSNEEVLQIFSQLNSVMNGVHARNVVVGDFNDLNVLFKSKQVFMIDADSMQFEGLPCVVATERFLDPSYYGSDFSTRPQFTKQSDYYAYAVMLFQSLLLVHPYGGTHKGFKTLLRRAEAAVSVFDKDVRYPKKAVHYSVLPDELLEYFRQVFDLKKREKIPELLLRSLRWTTCSSCGVVHARSVCPICAIAPAAIKETVVVRGKCTASRVFQTRGRILQATVQGGKLRYLYEDGNSVRRENQEVILKEKADRKLRFGIMGNTTIIGQDEKIALIRNGKVEKLGRTGTLGNLPVFDSNQSDYFTLSSDFLARNETETIGQILENQTWFRVGPEFGLGFYRVGLRTVYFVFNAHKGALDDSIQLPQIKGKLVDAECVFSSNYALLTTSRIENGKTINAMYLIRKDGTLKASTEAEADNSRMLSSIRGKAIGGSNVLCATDDGLLLVVPDNGHLVEAKLFADTEPFVDEASEIHPAANGVYVVSDKDIKLLRIG
ncbi:serine/threonine protein kinase [Candidatus Kuenenbacteria bacterium]|nr:serine/threonine protein kinase [Candidatus Kuenenbacteria bacterium]